MDDKKRKKSGHEFRKQKKIKILQESAKTCSRITNFYSKPSDTETPSQSSCQDQQTICEINLVPDEQCLKSNSNNQQSSVPSILEREPICDSKTLAEPLTQQELLTPVSTKKKKFLDLPISEAIDYFKKPNFSDLSLYFAFHPIQPNEKDLPFTGRKPLFNIYENTDQTFKRHWLTYNEKTQQLFCFICIAFSNGNSVFCSGFNDWRHVHQRVQEHETSKSHIESVKSFMAIKHKKSTHDFLFTKQMEKRRQEVRERRHIVEIVIDVLKLIGKQGLAFRGSAESACTFDNDTINHGNFLEVILLLGKYDSCLEKHLNKIIEKSKAIRQARKKEESDKKAVGRGNHTTFLSNNTVVKIIKLLCDEIKEKIAADVKTAVKYSILMDTTMDISSNDQCAFVIRYVKGYEVFERLLALKCVISTTGEDLFNSLRNVLEEVQIPLENCVANAFDGASNMSGQYKGVTAKLSEMIPNHIHTWCYAHVLNLVLSDAVQSLPVTISFFNVLQETQVFLKESLKRLQKFLEENPFFKLEAIGATRWRSRSDATVKIFGRIDDWTEGNQSQTNKLVYLELIIALFKISNSSEFNSKIRNNAAALLQKFTSFETILIAMLFLQIFKITTPLSDYLQTKNLDYVQAWRLIESSKLRLNSVRDKFSETIDAAKTFALKMSTMLDNRAEMNSDLENIYIETELPKKRQKKVKKFLDEVVDHENVGTTPEDIFRISIFNCVLDTINQTMENRFLTHKNLYLDLAWFDPKRFKDYIETLPPNALDKICELIPSLDKGKLKEELLSFTHIWPKISKKSIGDEYNDNDAFEEHETEFDCSGDDSEKCEAEVLKCSNIQECNSCIKCAFKVLLDYNMYCRQYVELFKVYKFLLTIPLTQVTCERVFSKVKIIKNRLRSSMSNNILEAFVLMQSEKDILSAIDSEVIIDRLCESSSEMRRLLVV